MGQINQNDLLEVPFKDFSGGQASAKGETSLAPNEWKKLNNVVVLPGGTGARSKPGNTAFNSSAMSGGHPVMGIGYSVISGTEYMLAVADNKLFKSDDLDGTMDDITGSLSISSDPNYRWKMATFNSLTIGVGGEEGSPDAPWKWSGSGDAAILGGSPPSADSCFVHNNRLFLCVQSTDTLYWSAIRAPEDWSTTGDDGTGSSIIGKGDGGKLVTGISLNLSNALVFKTTGPYILTGRTSPFAIFPLQNFPGIAGRDALVAVDGLCYYVTPQKRMVITDGTKVFDDRDLPSLSNMDDVWDDADTDRLKYICGSEVRGKDFHWIVWSFTKDVPGKNTFAAIWDLKNKCWVQADTGFESNGFVYVPSRGLYMAGYDGKIYKCLVEGTYTEASNSSSAISWAIESDQLSLSSVKISQVRKMIPSVISRYGATMTAAWGYDSNGCANSKSTSIGGWGSVFGTTSLFGTARFSSEKPYRPTILTLGRGNTFKFRLSGSSQADYRVQGVSLWGGQSGNKQISVR